MGSYEPSGLSVLNSHATRLSGPSLLHELVQPSCSETLPALEYFSGFEDRISFSYRQLHELSDSLAATISQWARSLPEDSLRDQFVVPLMIPQSPQLYIAQLAILKAGGAFCPLNLDAPVERIKFILDDVHARLVLVSPSHKARIPEHSRITTICVDDFTHFSSAASDGKSHDSARVPTEQDLAYVMYTSGSTGMPKGVAISHLAATQSLLAHDRHLPSFSRFLQFAAPTFDVSVFEIYFPLFRGSTLVCCDRASMLTDLPGIIRKLNVDACELTPSVAGSLLKSRANAPCLRLLLTIGEMLTQPVVDEFAGGPEHESLLWGMYGPTEATIHCTLQPAFSNGTTPKCIGFPLDTVSAFVIGIPEDDKAHTFELLPIGQAGELAVGGFQLATGYINRPEQTKAAFIHTDFGMVYKTGDKALMRPDGTIECLGRVAEGQVKLNGQRLELGEIEHAILRTDGCHSAFVCVLSNLLVAFTAVESEAGMEERIINTCHDWLPAFMIPADIIILQSFPRLPSGKIDRQRLKQDYVASQSRIADGSTSDDALLLLLCGIAGDVLGSAVSSDTRLASAGMDSLSSIDFATRIREQGYQVTTLAVLNAKTVYDLYSQIQGQVSESGSTHSMCNETGSLESDDLFQALAADPVYKARLGDIRRVWKCTSLQVSMLSETLRDPRLYVNAMEVAFPKGTAATSVKNWLSDIAAQNEIVRSGFVHSEHSLVQVVWDSLLPTQVVAVEEFGETPIEPVSFLERPLQVQIVGETPEHGPLMRMRLHHALYDGWSFDLLLDDLDLLSQRERLPPRPQFRHIAPQIDADGLHQADAAAYEFWADYLRGAANSQVPNFRTVAVASPAILSSSWEVLLDPQTARYTASRLGVSSQAIFQACLSWMWSAITGSEDITFGSVFSGRTANIPGIERVFGPCIQTLPLRVKIGESRTIDDLIHHLHSTTRQMLQLPALSLSKIKNSVDIPPGSRLFDLLFVYQESLSTRNRRPESVKETWHMDYSETKLILEVAPGHDRFICKWTWHTDCFPTSQVEALSESFSHLVHYFFGNPERQLNSILPSFPNTLLSEYGLELRPVASDTTIVKLVEKAVERSPRTCALCFADSITASGLASRDFSYEELNGTANKIARRLLAQGLVPGGLVAIVMEKSPMLYCGILGILKAGCAYLPILPSTPVKRIQLIFDQAQPQLCLVEDLSLLDLRALESMPGWRSPDHRSRTTLLDVGFSVLDQYDSSNLEAAQDASQLAYVIYTSGTTGTPKGVAVTNKNLVSNITVLSRIYPHDHGSRMLQACSQAFDVSVFEIFFAWANGMCLCAATNDTLFESLELSIRQMEVTHLSMTVTVASLMNPDNVPGVKFLVTSGEPMTDEVLKKWANVLYQGYGPSETTNICTVRKVSKGDSAPYLGWSFENTSSIVLSPESDDAVPIGYIGELCFGGEQVAAGYLNMPELTASKFPEHPRYGRLYRSGDLGRMLPDGSLIISGRIDTQIKLRGQRIELQDTHSAIFKSAFAKACASLLVDRQSSRSQQLVTFYVPLEEAPGDFSVLPFTSSRRQLNMAISQMLRATLPAYMIPTFLVPISSVPLTSSGKVDARELRQTFESMPEASLSEFSSEVQTADDATKWTATERLLAQVLTEILAIDPTLVNRWVSLNSLGLDSISAITFARKLQDALHRRVPISLILQSGSVARLAQSLQAADLECMEENQSQWLSSSVIANVKERFTSQENAHAIESILPCTPLQEAMLASSSSTSDGLSYCNQMLFRLHQDPQQIIGHWEEMHQRHGILRTCFMSTETTAFPVVQVVMASFAPAWKYWRSVDMDQCILEQMKSIQNAIDTFRPPISLAIICTSQNEKYLSFVCHHAMYDGIAIDILLSEIESSARDLPLLPTVSFGPFLREALNLPPDTGQFWAEHLLSFAPQQLPQDIRSSQSAVRRDDASTSLTRDLDVPFDTMEERIRELGGSLLSLCQAAWAMSLSAVLQVPDVCFGNVISGRSINQDGIERLVAPCFNTIPLRTDLSALASNRAVVNHFRKLNADILPYQFTPLRRIRASTGLNDAALFETVLLLQPTPRQLDSSIWELEQESGSMGVPLICEVVPSNHNNKLTTTLHRDSACFSERVAMLLQDLFAHFMDVCLRLPSSQLSLSSNLPIDFEGLPSSTHLTTSSPEPDSESSPVPHGAWSETEQKIRVVVAKLSKMPETRIERQTSFYRLGLDSIAIVQLAFLLRQNNLDVSAVDVLAKPTCAAVALLCASQQSAHGASTYSYDLAAFTQRTRDSVRQANLPFKAEKVLPCTPLQQGMISQFLFSKGQSYFNYVSWTLDQDVDTARLKSAWELAVRRHEILRAGFLSVTHPDTPFAMVVYGHCDASAPVECISGERWHKADIEKWRIDCSKRALHELYRPPWNVALVQWPNGKEMHLAMHHALYDASSLKELLEDLNLLLKDTEPRAPSPLDRTILPLLSQVYEEKTEAENFWSRKASELVVNTFPTMTPLRIEPQKALTTSRECSLKNSVLRERAAQGETTIQAALQAALTRLLASYLGENAVTFGVVLNSRPGETRDGALFPQLATLPVIARHFDSNRQILDSMMEYNASLRRFINTPLSQVQKWLGHSGAPLFDTLLVYQPYEQQLPTSQPWRVIDEWATVDYPLSLEAEESASGSMRFNLVFQPHILPKEQADLFLSQFDALFTQLLDSPEGNAQQVAEKHQSLFSILPAEYAELPSKVYLLHQFVELNAVDFPQSPALDFVEDLDDADRRRHWNYRELNECGNQIANLLVSQGVRPGGIVAVCFDKCPEAYLAILGILKAGCAFVALDTGAPPSRQEFILGDSGAVALLVKKTSTSSLGFRSPAPLLEIDLEGLASLSSSPPKLARPVTPDDTCYCLYTSGTTGTPKGCLITHDNTVQAMLAFQDLFSGHWDGSSRWLQFASLHFDVSVLEQYWSWSVGITVVSAPRDLILSDLVRTISELDITHIDLTPSLARLVHPDEVPSLCKGVFITGGEQLRQDILDVWGSKSVIYNAYGPTEATIGVTMYQRVPQNGRSSNIGRQFLNVGSFVLQPGTDIPVLKGGVGELCVSGKLVGRGYLNRDELTEERFPTLKRYDTRVYRTGDLVRVLHDGCFDFLGRADDQVKLRGQRLEIGEINHAIRAGVSEVLDVATLVTKHGSQDRDVLVTFIVASSSNNKDRELATLSDPLCRSICGAAQDACRAKLPGYMVPTYVLAVPFIPLSANNKAQTNMLKGIFNNTTLEQLRRMAAAPGDEGVLLSLMEPRLAGILAEVTGFDEGQILTSSTIFELGFDSISVVALARRLQEAGFNGADPSTILQHPRLADLRKRLREASDTTITSQVVPINQAISAFYHKNLGAACEALGVSRGDISYVAPCTALQEGMLSRSAVAEGQETYFNTFRLELKPDISNERLRSAWKTVVDNNAILRTCFLQTPDGHAQVSLKSPGFSWSDHRLHEEDIGEYLLRRYTNWVRANETNVVRPYEIDSIGYNNNHILIVRMFHGIYDARSLEIILHNVKAAYEEAGQLTGPPFFDVLPHGPLCNFDASRPFWLERFDGFIPHPISGLTNHTQEADVTQSRVLAFGGLDSRRMSLGVTQQAVIQAAWLFVLKQNYPNWPAVGVIFSGRSLMLEGVNNTVGPLFNTLPFRVRDSSVKDWPGLILETHQFNSSALPFVHTPLRQIQKWCSRGRPLFDTLFSFGRDNTSLPLDKNIWAETGGMSKADYPLACEVVMTTDGKLRATLVAQGHISGLTGLDELLDGLEKALSSAISQDTFPGQDAPSVGPLDLHLDEVGHDSDNGEAPTQPPSEFMWDEEARMLRREIATLAEIDIEQVMEDTNLLELGLDSIDAVKLVARLRRLGTSVTTGQLMKQPTIRAILENHQNSRPNGDQKRSPRYELTTLVEKLRGTLEDNDHASQDAEAVLPPTPLQDSMVAEMIQSDFQRYFSHDVLELSPGTDLGRVQEAIRNVISQSPILRSCFVAISNPEINFAYCQVVHRDIDAFQPLVSLDNLDSWGSILEQARARAAIAQGRSNLLQLSPFTVQDRQFIVLSISHALYDGVSLDLFHQDVLAAYHGKYQKRKSYEDVLGCILTSSHDTAKKFWSGFLHGANTTLVVEREDAVIEADMMHRVEISSATEPSYVRAFCKKRAITTQTLGQSCWAAVLSTLVQSLDVTFGVVLSGRDTDEAQDLMFPTMNTVPVRVVLHGTVEEYIQYVWGNLSAINEFQHFPLRAAQKLVGRGPLFNTLFTMQTQTQANQRELSPIWESIQSASQVEYPICVEMELTEDRLLWRLACDLHYMTRDKADDILHQIDQVMSYLVRGDGKSTISLDPHGQVSVCSLPQFQVADTMSRGAPQPRVEFEQNERGSERREIESKVIEVLADISKVDRSAITADQSIYHLGLDSISAIKVSSVLRKKGLQISVRDMVKAASIRDFTYIASQKSGPQNTVSSLRPTQQLKALTEVDLPALLSRAGLSPDVVEKTLPALPVQAHFLTQWQNTGGQLFLYDFFYEASGSVSKEAVEHAWHVLVSEAPILRTQFIATGLSDIPFVQAILRAQQEPSDAISDRGDGNADWCFDGRAGSFAHLTAVHKRGEASVELRLRIHHALYDGVSLPLMAERFRELCQDRTLQADHYAPLWEDFVLQHYALEAREQRKAFWVQYLRGATTAPTRPSTPDKSSRTSEFQPAALHQISALRTLASQNGVSLQALFFAAHGRVLAKRRGLEVTRDDVDVVFGVYLANRTSYDGRLERTLYPTVSIVPLRIQIRASDSLAAVAARIQKDIRAISSFENATVGLWEIEQWTGVRLDSFVNFLHLPSRDEAVGQGDEVEGVLLREKKENDAAYSHELPTPNGMAQPTDDWLARNPVRETYVDAVDVEAAINGESLDVGVFSSAALLSTSEAASWVDELVGHLGSV